MGAATGRVACCRCARDSEVGDDQTSQSYNPQTPSPEENRHMAHVRAHLL
jgi:hypothetical protein